MNRAFITGDFHADFTRLASRKFPVAKELDRGDIVICCGDFGGIWDQTESPSEKYWLDWLEEKPYTVVFCDGNHENFDRLNNEFPIVDFYGARAHQIRSNIFHILRGEIMEFAGHTFFFMGGARSHDIDDGILDPAAFETEEEFKRTYKEWWNAGKMFRVKGISWWEDEMPSIDDYVNAERNLAAFDNEVDFVITHCAPRVVAAHMGYKETDALTQWLEDRILNGVAFRDWFFGHYHRNENYDFMHCLYDDFVELNLEDDDE